MREAAERYTDQRRRKKDRKPLAEKMKDGIRGHPNRALAEIADIPMAQIDRPTVKRVYNRAAASAPTQAGQAMRYLRAILNFARAETVRPDGSYEIPDSPVNVLTEQNIIGATQPRESRIPLAKVGTFLAALHEARTSPDTGSNRAACEHLEMLRRWAHYVGCISSHEETSSCMVRYVPARGNPKPPLAHGCNDAAQRMRHAR